MRYLDAAALRRALPMHAAIEAMEAAFGDDIEVPVRVRLGPSLFMPGWVEGFSGIKVVSTVPGNPVGIVAVFDTEGDPVGITDATALTTIRTAAGAALATRLLARPDARTLAMLGAGTLAPDLIAAMKEVRPIDDVLVWSRTGTRARTLASDVGGSAVAEAGAAVASADVVCTATPSRQPLFEADDVRPGTHVNAVGAFTPEMVEVPAAMLRRALIYVDDRRAAAAEAGDLIQAGREPDGSIADLLAGRVEGRRLHDDVTMFKSVGIASQDVAAAVWALRRAAAEDLGVEVSTPGVTPPSAR
jgi:ornithine cyclodeaminase